MKIIAKKGSELEQTVKQMADTITEGIKGSISIVEEFTGVKPENIMNLYHWGTISKLVPEFIFSKADESKIDPRFLRKKKGENDVYVPSKRYKEGKALYERFRKFADEHEVTDEPLHKFGIHMTDWKNGRSYGIKVAHDTKNNRYILVCSDSIPTMFDKKCLAKDQFEIEY